jgi:4-amino-4-deoxy-L-arabinose transferase-like glycosyltransferase
MSGKPDRVISVPSPPVSNFAQTLDPQANPVTKSERLDRWLPWILGASAIFILFYQLGSAALFEPDEGRNAEKAREILLLGDWVTPHENFHPVLDKPIAFYWLIAISYKLFGISEWAARLPSALAALACVALVYAFARVHWGKAQALWSGLILLTSMEFFLLARLVIFDMALTFFLTLALCAFYQASHSDGVNRRRVLCLLMYGALGAATLIKGLIGIVVPGMVIFCYLLLTQQWSILRRIYLAPGALIFLAIVLPWYLEAGARHQGYLRYFFWDEHFGRFAGDQFDRTQPWYYFILVGLVGFFPWTLLWPFAIAGFRRRACDDKTLFLLLWVGVTLLFFTASKSKLPHYILPIFPALAVLTASWLVSLLHQSAQRAQAGLSLTRIAYGAGVLYFIIGYWQPAILPQAMVTGVTGMPRHLWIYGVLILVLPLLLTLRKISRHVQSQPWRYLAQVLTLSLFLIFSTHAMIAASSVRSAKALSDKALPLITPETQVVCYDTYLYGMGFYLRSEKPIWVISHSQKKRTFLGNYYALGGRAQPYIRWGKALFNFDEFGNQWPSTKQPLLILVKKRSRAGLEQQVGEATKKLASVDNYVLLTKN